MTSPRRLKYNYKSQFCLSLNKRNLRHAYPYRSQLRHTIDRNFILLTKRLTAYYGLNNLKLLKRHLGSPSLITNLERRADVLLFRLHWAYSIFQAREFIKAGHLWFGAKPLSHWNTLLTPGHSAYFISLQNHSLLTFIALIKRQILFLSPKPKNLHRPFWRYQALLRFGLPKTHWFSLKKKRLWNWWISYPSNLIIDDRLQSFYLPVQSIPLSTQQLPFSFLQGFGIYLKKL